MNRNLDNLFNSKSNFPTFVLAPLAFIYALVSLPVYKTIPNINPFDASTVLAHKAFSNESGSIYPYEEFSPFPD
jgi:hypothetical protein